MAHRAVRFMGAANEWIIKHAGPPPTADMVWELALLLDDTAERARYVGAANAKRRVLDAFRAHLDRLLARPYPEPHAGAVRVAIQQVEHALMEEVDLD